MNLKKIKIINLFIVFLLCFPLHFTYKLLPNIISIIFTPVNESIWEHMKLIYTSFILGGIIDFILLKKYIKVNNFMFQLFIVPVIGIFIYLLIYLPLYNIMGENMVVSILLLFIIIIIEEIISYFILNLNKIKFQNIIGISGIILVYIIFAYLTYNPIMNYIFFDTENDLYGINTYIID